MTEAMLDKVGDGESNLIVNPHFLKQYTNIQNSRKMQMW